MSPTINILTKSPKDADARVTANVDFHLKDGKVVHLDITITDGVNSKRNIRAIAALFVEEDHELEELIKMLTETDVIAKPL